MNTHRPTPVTTTEEPIITAELGEREFRALYEDLWAGKIAFVNVEPLSKHAFSALSRIWYDAESNELHATHEPGAEPLCFDLSEHDYRGMLWNTKYKYLLREIGSFQVEVLPEQPDAPEVVRAEDLTDDELTSIVDRLLKGEVELLDLRTGICHWDRVYWNSENEELRGVGFRSIGEEPHNREGVYTNYPDVERQTKWLRNCTKSFRIHELMQPAETADSEDLTPEQTILLDLVNSPSPAARTQAARSRHLTLAQQQRLSKCPKFMTRSFLAENPITDLSILRELAQDEHDMVASVAAHAIVQRIG